MTSILVYFLALNPNEQIDSALGTSKFFQTLKSFSQYLGGQLATRCEPAVSDDAFDHGVWRID